MIEKIEIQYFRSVYRVVMTNLSKINILSGKNDVGKSNVLKALNLFFNNYIEYENDFVFLENYNIKRLNEVRKDTIKGKQFIQIKITFSRGDQYEKTLPKTFTVSKKWNRDDKLPTVTDNIEKQLSKEGRKYNDRCRASLTRYLNNIKYIYVPAIKDEKIFENMISRLQEVVYSQKLSGNKDLSESLNVLFENVTKTTEALSNEFKQATSIDSMIATPTEVDELYKTLRIMTRIPDGTVNLKNRGDGIRVRYIPSILNYISENSSGSFIWGFEEPENSLEYNLASLMAEDFYNKYSKKSLIILTTHSPAFIDLGNKEFGQGYRCFREDNVTKILNYEKAEELPSLAEELGYIKILQDQYEKYKETVEENKKIKDSIRVVEDKLKSISRTVLFTEGKTDAIILNQAWEKLYNEACPFDIMSCNLLEESAENALAGASILKSILCSCRYDSVRTIIGLFDNDKAGRKEFGLDKNYISENGKTWKKHKNGKGFAFLIPATTPQLEQIASAQNLSIEFLFDKEYLYTEIEGERLGLTIPNAVTRVGSFEVEQSPADDTYWYLASLEDATKTYFAEKIVPTFPIEAFENFKPIFEIVKDIQSALDKQIEPIDEGEN